MRTCICGNINELGRFRRFKNCRKRPNCAPKGVLQTDEKIFQDQVLPLAEQMNQSTGLTVSSLDNDKWSTIEEHLNCHGFAVIDKLLTQDICTRLIDSYADKQLFRSHINMAQHGFGQGEYQYYADPIPDVIMSLRTNMYPPLAQIANRWSDDLGSDLRYPTSHASFLERCHASGQNRPTPLILRYRSGDYNCLHQDLYGDHVFPLQIAVLLSDPDTQFSGGEFVLTEQRPRMQSRVEVVQLKRGDAVLFPVHHRPKRGTRGFSRTNIRHGVSRLHSGERFTLGIIFHDAE